MKDKLIALLKKAVPLKEEEIANMIEVPPEQKLGDFSFPCFALAKVLKKSPNDAALEISKKIKLGKEFEKLEVAGPYINFFVSSGLLAEQLLSKIQKEKGRYGSSKIGKEKVMVEFSQPNTHKAFHVGHIRGTSLGESLARILEFSGDKVIRANYMGDTGMHIAKWIWCYQKYHKKEKISNGEKWIAEIYVDAVKKLAETPDFQPEVDEINRKIESKEDKDLNEIWKKTRKFSLEAFDKIYKEMDTKFDVYFFESEVEKRGKEISLELVKKGIARVDDGAAIMDLKDYNLGVWVLLRKDGTALYSAKDLALAERKFGKFKIDKAIYVLGTAQKMHFYQLLKTLELMNFNQYKKCEYVPLTEVRLPTGKMSSRTGENVLYSSFMEELTEYAESEIKKRHKLPDKEMKERAQAISIASIKYSMLKQDTNKVIVFNKEESLDFEGDTGPYLLYTYARARSILKKAGYNPKKKYKSSASENAEKNLIVQLSKFPEVTAHAFNSLAPNLIANYAYHLCQAFNEFYHADKVIGSENEQFRLVLVDSFSQVLKNALSLLGIRTIEQM